MVTQSDVDAVYALRKRLENEYGKSRDERLVMVVSYIAAAQAAMRLLLIKPDSKSNEPPAAA
jgi:hypothetical protein